MNRVCRQTLEKRSNLQGIQIHFCFWLQYYPNVSTMPNCIPLTDSHYEKKYQDQKHKIKHPTNNPQISHDRPNLFFKKISFLMILIDAST